MIKKIGILGIVVSVIFGAACNNTQQKNQDKHATPVEHKEGKKDCADVHWSYHDENTSPEHWADLCEGFSACNGQRQSPIDIITDSAQNCEKLTAIKFHYGKTKIDIVNNSHTIQFNVSGDNYCIINKKQYKLLQFHFHALSEHTVNGEHFPLEVHFVHILNDSNLAVLGILFNEGESYDLFTKYLDKFPKTKGEFTSDSTINLMDLLPENKSYFFYKGSLTTPPCSEIVNWYVLKNQLQASKEQLDEFSEILHNNNRPVLPLGEREIKFFEQN